MGTVDRAARSGGGAVPVKMGAGALARVLFALASALWLTAIFLPATATGAGATLTSHRLADLLASGALPTSSAPSWLGLVWYVVPVGAALTLMALGLGGRRGAVVRIAVAVPTAAAALAFAVAVCGVDLQRFGLGLWCAVGGAACAALATALEIAQPEERGDRVL